MILFDVFHSGEIIKNPEKAKISLSNIYYLALNHGYLDPTEDLKYVDFSNANCVLAHPAGFQKKYFKNKGMIRCPISLNEIKKKNENCQDN